MCTLVDLCPLAVVAFTLSMSLMVYGPAHCALSLRDLPRCTLSTACSFVGPAVFRNAPLSCPFFQLSFCVHADEPSVTGLSIRTRSRHNYTAVWAASSKQRVGLRDAQTATRRE